MNSIKNLLVIALFLIPVLSSGQDQSSKTVNKGLTVSIQDRELGIMVPFYLSTKFILAPGFQFVSASKVGTDIGLGLATKAFLNDHKSIRPYWGLKAGLGFYKAPNTSNQIDIILGAAFGVEYFFNPNFSIGGEFGAY